MTKKTKERKKGSKKYKLIGILSVSVSVLALAVVGIIAKISDKGCERVLKKYVEAIENEDGKIAYSLFAPEYVDFMWAFLAYSDEEETMSIQMHFAL